MKRTIKRFTFLFSVSILLIQGCCPDEIDGPNDVYKALTRYELTTFVDSSGNHTQLLLNLEGHDRYVACCDDCPNGADLYKQSPLAEFVFLPPEEGTVSYQQGYNQRLSFPKFSIWYFNASELDTTIQGHAYFDCWWANMTDSLENEVYSVILDKHFGLVMFSYRDQYRWERVLD